MDLGFIFLAVALIGLVIFVVAQPFFERVRVASRDNAAAEQLGAQRDSILTAVRDLDFDHVTGKIADEDYTAQRALLMARGADVLKQLDSAGVVEEAQSIEQAIADRRRSARPTVEAPTTSEAPTPSVAPTLSCPDCGTAYRAGDRFCSGCGRALTRACGQCGSPVSASDRFCGKCGAPVVAVEAHS